MPRSGFFLRMSKVADEAKSQEYLDAVERLEPEVDDLARKIVDNLSIEFLLLMIMPDVIDLCIPTSITKHYT